MRQKLWWVALALMASACVTINVYFPEAAIKDLSQQIEEQVQKQAAEKAGEETTPPPPEPEKKEGTGPAAGVLDGLFFGVAYAADDVAAPEVSSPAIRKIISTRAERAAALRRLKDQGVIGETNQALLEIRNLEFLADLKARAEAQRLVRAENADREQLFLEIAAAKGVDKSQVPRIRETYAATLRENASPGDLIQVPGGEWKKKE